MLRKINKCINYLYNQNVYLVYSFIFILMTFCVFYQFIISGTSFIWKIDLSYNFKTFVYVSRYFKDFFYNLIVNNKIILNSFDFSMWEGYDILQALHYPSYGDPFVFLSFLVPEKYLYICYEFIALLKIYLAGLGFIAYLRYHKVYNNFALLAGACTYIFCYYSILNVARHLCFLTGILYMPYILRGADYIFDNKKPYLYIISIFLIAISNIFFFYQIVILIIVYVIVKASYLYFSNNKKLLFIIIFKFAMYSLLAICMASFIFIPMIKNMLSDQRIQLNNYFFYLYPPYYYQWLITDFFTHGMYFWVCMGFASPSILAVLFLLKNRKNYKLVFYFYLISFIFILFPIFGKIFNGGAYITNRWSWVLALIIGYIVSITYDNLMVLNRNDSNFLIASISIYAFLLFYFKSNKVNVYLSLCVVTIVLLVIINITEHRHKQFLVLLLYMISIFLYSFYLFSPKHRNYIKECIKQDNLNNYTFNDNEGKVIKDYLNEVKDDEYSRYTGTYWNDRHNNLINNISSTAHYFPISNSYASNFIRNYAMSIHRNFVWNSYDEKTIINELSSVKYFATQSEKDVPYGYTLVKDFDKFSLYKNNCFVPVLYTYDSICDETQIDKLNYPTKQEITMKSAVVDNYIGMIKYKTYEQLINNIQYKIKPITNDVYVGDNYFMVYNDNQQVEIEFDGLDNSETYCFFNNLNYLSLSEHDLYRNKQYNVNNNVYDIDPYNRYSMYEYDNMTNMQKLDLLFKKWNMIGLEKTEIELFFNINSYIKKIKFLNNRSAYYGGFHNFLMNLGYNEKKINKFIITLPYSGIYTFDDIQIYCDNLIDYEKDVKNLTSGNITNINIGNDMITANTNSDTDKFLCAAIPYYEGWKAYVDGVETPVYLTNYYHMGIDVPKGKHEIKFVYNNIFIFYGRILTLIGFIIFAFIIIYNKNKRYIIKE